ncbi:formate hydrogenlyase [Oenococcus sp. UCMA 17063]|nr:formate hydrogenlyase [Oenococcus sp. UCMA 17063]
MFKIICLELKAYWRETSFDKLALRLIFFVFLTSFFIVYGAGIFFQGYIASHWIFLCNCLLLLAAIGWNGGFDLFKYFLFSKKNKYMELWPRKKYNLLILKSFKYEVLDNSAYFVFLLILSTPLFHNFRPYLLWTIFLSSIIYNSVRKFSQIINLCSKNKVIIGFCFSGIVYLVELLMLKNTFSNNSAFEITNIFHAVTSIIERTKTYFAEYIDYSFLFPIMMVILSILIFLYYASASKTINILKDKELSKFSIFYKILFSGKLTKSPVYKRVIKKIEISGYWKEAQRDSLMIFLVIFFSYLISFLLGDSLEHSEFTVVFFTGIFLIKTVVSFRTKIKNDLSNEIIAHVLSPGFLKVLIKKYDFIVFVTGITEIFVLILGMNLFNFSLIIFLREFFLLSFLLLANIKITGLFSGLFSNYKNEDSLLPIIGLLVCGGIVSVITEFLVITVYFVQIMNVGSNWTFVAQIFFFSFIYLISVFLINKYQRFFYGEYKKYVTK